jgi:hypothetical protein
MLNRPCVLLLSAAVISGIGMSAQTPPVAQSTVPASTTLRMRGTIEKYDPSTRILSISTPNAIVQFPIVVTARIRRGWLKIAASDLEQLSGYRAAVRYSESLGIKTVESIHVFGKSERTGR